MATTLIPFQPNASASPPFQTTVTLDGSTYTLSCFWLVMSQRWYFSLVDSNQNTILFRPITGSPETADLNMVFGYFTTSTLVYRSSTGNLEVTP